jgi:putative CocE/NonD family hydrolase
MSAHDERSSSPVSRIDDILIPYEGRRIAATRYSPTEIDGPLPAVLMSIPYRKDDYITYGHHDPLLRYVAGHGYEVVVTDLLGTGASGGRKQSPFESTEGEEVVAVIEWLADRTWTTGTVGMFGHSYGGQTQLRAADLRPEPLKAIVPVQPAVNYYDDALYKQGVPTPRSFLVWFQTLQSLPPSRRDEDGRWKEVWHDRLDNLRETTPFLLESREHDRFDDYWRSKVNPTDVDVPMLMVAGYRDTHPQCDIEAFREASGPKRLLLGPWRHGIPHEGRESAIDFRRQLVEWFDYFLKGKENGALDHDPVEFWTERNGGGRIDEGVWRGADAWPGDTHDERISFALAPSGLVAPETFTEGNVAVDYEFDHGVGIESTDYVVDAPTDTSADDARSACFETSPLDSPVEYTGDGSLSVRLRPTTPEPIVDARVVDVAPRGESRLVTYGFLNPSHRHGLEDVDPLVPGEEYDLEVPLRAKSHVFERGHRIRVAIAAAHFPVTLPRVEHGSFEIRSDPDAPSMFRFPGRVHADEPTFDDVIDVRGPDPSRPVVSPYVRDSSSEWTAARTHSQNRRTFRSTSSKCIDLPHGPTMTFERETEATTRANDPSSTRVAFSAEGRLAFGDETVLSQSSGRITPESAQLETEVTVDGYTVFDEFWSE